jgi:acyl-CoA reductase-like NAD-dependent aldehyde dehydrogenase
MPTRPTLTRFERAAILNRAAAISTRRTDEVAALITAEAGLCMKDALYEPAASATCSCSAPTRC